MGLLVRVPVGLRIVVSSNCFLLGTEHFAVSPRPEPWSMYAPGCFCVETRSADLQTPPKDATSGCVIARAVGLPRRRLVRIRDGRSARGCAQGGRARPIESNRVKMRCRACPAGQLPSGHLLGRPSPLGGPKLMHARRDECRLRCLAGRRERSFIHCQLDDDGPEALTLLYRSGFLCAACIAEQGRRPAVDALHGHPGRRRQ